MGCGFSGYADPVGVRRDARHMLCQSSNASWRQLSGNCQSWRVRLSNHLPSGTEREWHRQTGREGRETDRERRKSDKERREKVLSAHVFPCAFPPLQLILMPVLWPTRRMSNVRILASSDRSHSLSLPLSLSLSVLLDSAETAETYASIGSGSSARLVGLGV